MRDAILVFFLAGSLHAAPSLGLLSVAPGSIPANSTTTVSATISINDPTLLAGGVNLLRTDANGNSAVSLGLMQSGGAGQFSLQVPLTPTSAGTIYLQVSAAFRGVLLRVRSNVAPIAVTGGGNGPVITDFNPKTGPIGTLVTISGSNFGASPQVSMARQGGGAIPLPVSTNSGGSLGVVIPAGAATGAIAVSNGSASSSTASAFTVTPSNSFTLTASPAAATLIRGQSVAYAVQLTSGNGFNMLAQMSVTGVPAGVSSTFVPPSITAGQTSVLTLTAPAGQAIGNASLTVSAAATVDGILVTQTAPLSLAVVAPTTTLLGRTVSSDALETPVAGVTVTTLGQDGNGAATACTGHTTVTDGAGNFSLTNLPSNCTGPQLIGFDGNTVTAPPGRFAGVGLVFTLSSGQVTTSPVLVHLPRIDGAETFLVQQNAPADQTHAFTSIPGLSVTVYSGTSLAMPDGSRPNPFPLTAVQVPVDRLPDSKPDVPTMLGAFYVSFQPTNATATQPIAVTYPNTTNSRPGTNMVLTTLDPSRGKMVPYGTGTVSSDASQVVPDPDPAHPGHRYGLVHFDWHLPMPPPEPDIFISGDGVCFSCCDEGSGATCGLPIDLGSGVDVIQSLDMSLGGPRGAVNIVRTMRSAPANGAGPFGVGGDFNFNLRLDTNTPNTANSLNLVMPDGRRVPFIRQPNGKLINTVNPSMLGTALTTAADNSATLRYKSGVVQTFIPTSTFGCVLSTITDSNGNTITLSRNPSAMQQIVSIADPAGRQLSLTWDSLGGGRITSITDPAGRVGRYTYTSDTREGSLESFTDPNGGVWQYTYDSQNNLLTVTDPRGVLLEQNTYDANNRVIAQKQADGSTIRISYTLLNSLAPTSPVRVAAVTDQLGRKTTYRFNSQGYLIQATDATGQSRAFNRASGTNLLLGVTGPGTCDTCGDPTGGDRSYTYDASGNRLTSTDSLGNTYTYTYDPSFGKLASVTDPAGGATRFQYDANGNLTSMTDPRGNQTTVTVGQFGLPATVTDAAGQTTTFEYDPAGNLIAIHDPAGNTTTMRYDKLSRLVQTTGPTGARFSSAYDLLDRIVRQTDGVGGTTRFTYDGVGNVLTVTDPRGGQITNTYDALSRLTRRQDALGRPETFAYDAVGNLTSQTDRRGQTAQFTYDSLDRLVGETYVDATVTRAYDSNSRLAQVNDSQSGAFTFQYDSAGRLLRSGAPNGSIAYTYDRLGRIASRQVAGLPAATYQYDAAGNLTLAAMAGATQNMTYDARNLLASVSRSNGVNSAYTYDQMTRVLSIAHQAGATSLASFAYTYDAAGNRSSARTNLAQPLTTQSATVAVDAANQMTSFGGRRFTHDANGNRLTDSGPSGSTTYTWDGRNRLSSIVQPTGETVQLGYDFERGLMRQSVMTGASSVNTSFVTDQVDNVVAIAGDTGGPMSLLSGDDVDQSFAVLTSSGQVQFALSDGLGSIAGNSGSSASLDGQNQFEPFGQTTSSGAAYPFGFAGRQPVAGSVYYNRNRLYDASVGRFLSEDPLGLAGGDFNLYRYVANSPLSLVDPFGLASENLFPYNRINLYVKGSVIWNHAESQTQYANDLNVYAHGAPGGIYTSTNGPPYGTFSDLMKKITARLKDKRKPKITRIDLNICYSALGVKGKPALSDQVAKALRGLGYRNVEVYGYTGPAYIGVDETETLGGGRLKSRY